MRVIRKALIVGTLLIASIVVMYSTVGKLKKTVREDERVHPSTRWAYGYRLCEYRFLQASHLSMWTPQMKLAYTLRAITIDEVVEARWLSQREAIYLRLHATVHDSINSPDSIRIILNNNAGDQSTAGQDYVAEEFQQIYVSRKANPQPLAERPLIVLTAGNTPAPPGTSEELWKELRAERDEQMKDLAQLSRNSKWIHDPTSGHGIHNENPRLVVDSILEVLNAVAKKARLNP